MSPFRIADFLDLFLAALVREGVYVVGIRGRHQLRGRRSLRALHAYLEDLSRDTRQVSPEMGSLLQSFAATCAPGSGSEFPYLEEQLRRKLPRGVREDPMDRGAYRILIGPQDAHHRLESANRVHAQIAMGAARAYSYADHQSDAWPAEDKDAAGHIAASLR